MTIPGTGPITAMAVQAFAPPMEGFRRGRDFSAWPGLVPRQHSTGGWQRLGRISKTGRRGHRRLLFTGAMVEIRRAVRRGAPEGSRLARMPAGKPRKLVSYFTLCQHRIPRLIQQLLVGAICRGSADVLKERLHNSRSRCLGKSAWKGKQ